MATENTQKPKDGKGTCEDTEADWDTTDTNTDRILTVDVESLCWPEQENGKKVGTGDEGNDKRKNQDSRALLEAAGEHWKFCEFPLPDEKCSNECGSNKKWCKNVCRSPWVLGAG